MSSANNVVLEQYQFYKVLLPNPNDHHDGVLDPKYLLMNFNL